MSVRNLVRILLAMTAAGLMVNPPPAESAETICTKLIRGPDGSIPMDERESERQVQARIKPVSIAEGDKLAREGKLAAAVKAYAGAFGGHWYAGFYADSRRCLSMDFYQGAADKLRAVASELAEQRRAKGHLLDESHEYGGEHQRGALSLYLTSNQYDLFVGNAISYAEGELLQRDIGSVLVSLVESRLDELQRTRGLGTEPHDGQYVNDLTPLLDEELAAFDKLADFDEKLNAHLAPLYPKITDHWLAEEKRNFSDAIKTDGMFPKGMMFGRAIDALENGIDRLNAHPEQMSRLMSRANARGGELMMQELYQPAEAYFEIAGNDQLAEKAGRLAEARQFEWAEKVEASVHSDIEKMKKSDGEQAAFQDETDDLAAEFGFDMED